MDKEPQNNSFYGITEISENSGFHKELVRRHIASGALSSTKIGGVYKIPEQALNDFINDIEIKNEELLTLDSLAEKPKSSSKSTNNYKNNSKDDVNWVDIVDDWKNPKKSKLTFVDLFSGVGGITKGFEMAGLNGVCGLDWFEAAGKNLPKKFRPSLY